MSAFDELVKNIECGGVDTFAYIEASKTIKRDYLILFTARSGSTWLTKLLSGHLGIPDEYLNPEFIALNCKRVGTKDRNSFIPALRGCLKINEVFGIEATSEHIELFGEDEFFNSFPRLTVFHLWRQNQVAQAISLYKAVKTGYFHSFEGERPADPQYEGKELYEWYKNIAEIENSNVTMLNRHNISPINITYENIVANGGETLSRFYRHLNIDQNIDVDSKEIITTKISNSWNDEVELKFRKEYADEINLIETSRMTNYQKFW